MKILIFSDSHGDSDTMCSTTEKEQPDMIIYLGDGIEDAEKLGRKYPDIEIIKNLGNVDSEKQDEEWLKYAEICGKRFMMTHGHTFFTGKDMTQNEMTEARDNILKFMFENNIDITLHGHIHEPFIYRCQMTPSRHGWIMCPGRIGRIMSKESIIPVYGILKVSESDALEWQFVEVGF